PCLLRSTLALDLRDENHSDQGSDAEYAPEEWLDVASVHGRFLAEYTSNRTRAGSFVASCAGRLLKVSSRLWDVPTFLEEPSGEGGSGFLRQYPAVGPWV